MLGLSPITTPSPAAPRTSAACARAGIEFVPGIEITAVADGEDVHVLGYFIDTESPALESFLAEQRQRRLDRVRLIVDRLAAHGIQLDADAILAPAVDEPVDFGRAAVDRARADRRRARRRYHRSVRAMAGHAAAPAFVPRMGAPPEEVFASIHDAGGVASLAHPALVGHDEWIPAFAAAGLDALEAYHSDHDAAATARYLALADRLGLAVSGGSDYHGDESHGPGGPGSVALPRDCFDRLKSIGVR